MPLLATNMIWSLSRAEGQNGSNRKRHLGMIQDATGQETETDSLSWEAGEEVAGGNSSCESKLQAFGCFTVRRPMKKFKAASRKALNFQCRTFLSACSVWLCWTQAHESWLALGFWPSFLVNFGALCCDEARMETIQFARGNQVFSLTKLNSRCL